MTEMAVRHWIDGGEEGDPVAESLDPATGERVGRFADGDETTAQAAVGAARQASDRSDWPAAPRLRQRVLLRWAAALEAQADALAVLLTRENGKAIAQSRGEMAGAISEILYYAGLARHIPGHVLEPEPGVLSTVLREPAGVAAIIVPWNAPAVLLVRSLAPALAAGCAAVVKPAARTAFFNAAILRPLLRDPELPPGVVNVIAETAHAGARYFVASHDVDVISFTGSTNVGKEIMRSAAGSMKKLSLELGGKSCSLVFQDADVAPVVARLAAAATIISGQQCTAARRVLVHSSRLAEMRAALAAALAALRVGPGLDAATEIGPLIDWSSRDQVAERIEQACAEADEVLLAPRIPGGALARGAEAETGGYRQSGLGRLHGYDALADFTELKHIYQAPGVTATAG